MGIAPTGNQVTITGITIHRIEDGKIVEEWENWDALRPDAADWSGTFPVAVGPRLIRSLYNLTVEES